ncbi:MAG TPA: hypothetical protein VIK93_02520 [Limnochordales bacterium]
MRLLRYALTTRRRRGALAAAALLVLVSLWPLPVLQVSAGREPGAALVVAFEAPLVPGETFGIRYRHSIFGVGVEERFSLAPRGFALVEVISTTDGIAEYYAFPNGRLEPAADHFRLVPGEALIISLPVRIRATPVGERTLVLGTRCVPLASLGETVELRWRRAALVRWLLGAVRHTFFGKDVARTCPVPAISAVSTTAGCGAAA